MNRYDVWAEYYIHPRTIVTDVVEIPALTAKQAMFLGLQFLSPSIPDGLSCEEIQIIVTSQEEEDDHEDG